MQNICCTSEASPDGYDEQEDELVGCDGGDVFSDCSSAAGIRSSGKPSFVRLPDLIDRLAKEGQVLRWDELRQWYEVSMFM